MKVIATELEQVHTTLCNLWAVHFKIVGSTPYDFQEIVRDMLADVCTVPLGNIYNTFIFVEDKDDALMIYLKLKG